MTIFLVTLLLASLWAAITAAITKSPACIGIAFVATTLLALLAFSLCKMASRPTPHP